MSARGASHSIDEIVSTFRHEVGRALDLLGNLDTDGAWGDRVKVLNGRATIIELGTWFANHDAAHLQQIRGVAVARLRAVTATSASRRPFEDRVDAVLRRLRPGEVVTYGEVAEEAGRPGAARAVGRLLATVDADWPWWRVVTASGRLVPGHETEHARRLKAEGVELRNGRVVLSSIRK